MTAMTTVGTRASRRRQKPTMNTSILAVEGKLIGTEHIARKALRKQHFVLDTRKVHPTRGQLGSLE